MPAKNKVKIGAINWDSFVSDGAYFTSHAMDSLTDKKYTSRLPYYIENHNGKYSVPNRTAKDYEKELNYAIECGIDFFAYCWYPDTEKEERTIWHDADNLSFLKDYYPELNYARKMYQKSSLKSKIGMCAIIFCLNSYSKSDFNSLFDAMKEDYYVKINEKPLLIIFDNYDIVFIELVREYAKERGITPYITFINTGAVVDEKTDYSHCDAVTAYGCGHSVKSFSEHIAKVRSDNEKRTGCGISVIPLMSAGWNPSPRIDHPKPWVVYADAAYALVPDESDVDEAFADLVNFIDTCPKADTGCALVFAWNEFEEGGYLCPTLKSDGSADESLIRYFAKAKKKYIEGV